MLGKNEASTKKTKISLRSISELPVRIEAREAKTNAKVTLLPAVSQKRILSGDALLAYSGYDGIIGLNYFLGKNITIDLVAKKMEVTSVNIPLTFNRDVAFLPLQYKDNMLFTKLKASRGSAEELLIDTGTSFLALSPDDVARFDLLPTLEVSTTTVGIGKSSTEAAKLLAPLMIGENREANLITILRSDSRQRKSVGMQLLSRFRITLMPATGTMALERNTDYAEASRLPGAITVIVAQLRGKAIITELLSGCLAEQAGLKKGDEILSIDAVTTQGMNIFSLQERLTGFAGATATLQLRRKERPITIVYNRNGFFDFPSTPKAGLGIVADAMIETTIKIIGIEPDSPAYDAKLMPGDEIISVNGKKIGSVPFNEIITELKRPIGSIVSLVVKNPKTAMLRSVTLTVRLIAPHRDLQKERNSR